MEGELLGGRYRLGRQIGAGGMGVVYEATDENLSNQVQVAVKVLQAPKDAGPTAIARLEREARATAALGHANIVRVTDLGRTSDGAYLVMERLHGRTLDEELAQNGPLGIERAARVHLQLLDALGAAHDSRILHRDVKPGNIYLTGLADGTELVKLLDFGLAYLLEEEASPKLTQTGVAIGTPAYMSPERMYGQPLDGRADLYAAGVSLYESLVGELPFEADNPVALQGKILLHDAPDVRAARPGASVELSEVITRALSKRPADRFDTAQDMARALTRAVKPLVDSLGGATVRDLAGPAPAPAQVETEDVGTSPTMPAVASSELPTLAPGEAVLTPPPARESPTPESPEPAAAAAEPTPSRDAPPAAQDAPGPSEAPRAPVTRPLGGVTGLPVAGAVAPPAAGPPKSRGLVMGLGLGAVLGVIVLGALAAVALLRETPEPAPTEVTQPTEARVTTPPEAPPPAPVVPPTAAPEADPPRGVDPPPLEPAPAQPSAPIPPPRPPRAEPLPHVEPLPPPPPEPDPPPRPRSPGLDEPMTPSGW